MRRLPSAATERISVIRFIKCKAGVAADGQLNRFVHRRLNTSRDTTNDQARGGQVAIYLQAPAEVAHSGLCEPHV